MSWDQETDLPDWVILITNFFDVPPNRVPILDLNKISEIKEALEGYFNGEHYIDTKDL